MFTKKVKAVNKKVAELRRIILVAMDYLNLEYKYSNCKTIFQIEFYNFLKKARDNEKLNPSELLLILVRNPELVKFIRKKDFDGFMNAVKQLSRSDLDIEIAFVTLFYDYYYQTKSIFNAILKAYHHKLYNFNKSMVEHIFNKYPFLTSKQHLDHVNSLLSKLNYACLLTKNGINEVYHV